MKFFFTLSGNEDAFNDSVHEVLMQAMNDVEDEPQPDAGRVM